MPDIEPLQIAIIQHLAGLLNSEVKVILEIEAEVPDHIVRAVMENCQTLKFKNHGFEKAENR